MLSVGWREPTDGCYVSNPHVCICCPWLETDVQSLNEKGRADPSESPATNAVFDTNSSTASKAHAQRREAYHNLQGAGDERGGEEFRHW